MSLIPEDHVGDSLSSEPNNDTQESVAKYVFRGVSAILVIDLVAKAVSFSQDILAARYFGASMAMDTFLAAAAVPMILGQVAAGSMTSAMLPALSAKIRQNKSVESVELANAVLHIFSFGVALVATVLAWTIPDLTKFVAPGLAGEMAPLLIQLFRLFLLMTVIQTGGAALRVVLLAYKKFGATSMGNLLNWLVVILSMLLFGRDLGVAAIVVGMIGGNLVSFLYQLIIARREGFSLVLIPKLLRIDGLRDVLMLSVPILLGEGVIQLTTVVDRALASGFATGSITALYYANKVVLLPHSLFAVALGTVLFPLFAEQSVDADPRGFTSVVKRGIRYAAYIQIPVQVLLAVFSLPLIRLFFQHGAFTSAGAISTSSALAIYSFRLFPLALNSLLIYGFYSKRDTVTPMVVGIATVCARIALSIWFAERSSWLGIAWAASITSIVSSIVLLYLLGRKTKTSLVTIFPMMPVVKIAVASLGSALAARGIYDLFFLLVAKTESDALIYQMAGLALLAVVALPIYLGLTYLGGLEETTLLISQVRQWRPGHRRSS